MKSQTSADTGDRSPILPVQGSSVLRSSLKTHRRGRLIPPPFFVSSSCLLQPAEFFLFRPPPDSSRKATRRRPLEGLTSEFKAFFGLQGRLQACLPLRALETGRYDFPQSLLSHGKDLIQNTEAILVGICHQRPRDDLCQSSASRLAATQRVVRVQVVNQSDTLSSTKDFGFLNRSYNQRL